VCRVKKYFGMVHDASKIKSFLQSFYSKNLKVLYPVLYKKLSCFCFELIHCNLIDELRRPEYNTVEICAQHKVLADANNKENSLADKVSPLSESSSELR